MSRILSRRSLFVAALSMLALVFSTTALNAGPGGGKGGGGGGGGGGPQNGTIVGEVYGPSGAVGGASVLLFDGISMDQVAETFTNSDGSFQFKKVPAGTYTATAVSLDPPCAGSTTFDVVPKKIVVIVIACQ